MQMQMESNNKKSISPTFSVVGGGLFTYIYNGRDSTIVDWLGAVRPHVRTFCQVKVTRTQTENIFVKVWSEINMELPVDIMKYSTKFSILSLTFHKMLN